MTFEMLLIWLCVGAVAGWLAGVVVKGSGFGLLGNIAVGVFGAVVGGWLFETFGIARQAGILGALFGATVGAVAILLLLRVAQRA